MDAGHAPVLYASVLAGLDLRQGGIYIDATVDGGGHAQGILSQIAPQGRLLGIDLDPQMLEIAKTTLASYSDQVTLVEGNFRNLAALAQGQGFSKVDGILFDLGISSMHLASPQRGFSFQQEGPLDMRFSPRQKTTAEQLVNRLPEKELADLLWRSGEEPRSHRIARAIIRHRPITTTIQLAEVVARAVGHRGRIHPATRSFQALRIAVNDELSALEQALPLALELLNPGGRLAVISFHSLEDRMVKHFFRSEPRLEVLTRKPIRPTREEISTNPRARSARLRLAARRP